MTIGQRIAQNRKERNLSQEALGEQLGVSRQAIYKWESDSALPEIDKLIALSKLFGLSVGGLLGVEVPESTDSENETAPPSAGEDGELTEAQLRMVEEITQRYLAAQPKPRRFPRWAAVVLVLAVLVGSWKLLNRLDILNQSYNHLQSSVNDIQNNTGMQINSLTNRVEEILRAQNSLTADYGTAISGCDLAAGTVTFSLYAVPKTYYQGMTVEFSADDGTGSIVTVVGQESSNQKFSTPLTCALTDSIALSAVFVSPDGTRQTQLLYSYESLYFESLPFYDVQEYGSMLNMKAGKDGKFLITSLYLSAGDESSSVHAINSDIPLAEIRSVRLGLFKNQKLVAWADPCDGIPGSFQGFEESNYQFFLLPDTTVTMEGEDILEFAAVITDEYGRQAICGGGPPYVLDEDGEILTWPGSSSFDSDLSHWTF